ncbi:MAG: FHA domain-containing protein [Armatimonadota bacterium]
MEDRTILEADIPVPQAGDATRVISDPMGAPTYSATGGPVYGDRTQQAVAQTCPVCQTPNPPMEQYCQDCGLLFSSVSGPVEEMPDPAQLPRLVGANGQELALNPGANSVGRESADVLLADPTVSRRHAQVSLEEGRVLVEDFGSTNGTYVSGRKLTPGEKAPAYDGDVVKFGSVALTLTLPGGGDRPAALPSGTGEAAVTVMAAPEAAADRGAPMARLILPDGSERPLYEGANTIGRRSGNDVVIADAFASGRHAEIRVEADGSAVLVDVGSTNGTFFNGSRVAANDPIPLEDGAQFTAGKTALTYHAAGAAPEASGEGNVTLMAGGNATMAMSAPPAGISGEVSSPEGGS